MPSAANAKLEKQASGIQAESSSSDNNNSLVRQVLVIIEHKIRNLEKRKTKLESYRAIQSSGKELSSDQKAAVAKYDEVTHSLEYSRELTKQIAQLGASYEKEQKKQARKEASLRTQAEISKIREVLTILDILSNFSDSKVREDFLNGTNGAIKLEENDLKILEKFFCDIQIKRQTSPEDTPFSTSVHKAAEYLSLTVDGRPKQYGETTFENVRRILVSIQESGYLDKGGNNDVENEKEEEVIIEGEENDKQELNEELQNVDNSDARNIDCVVNSSNIDDNQKETQQEQKPLSRASISSTIDVTNFQTEAPSAAAVPAPSFPPQSQPGLVNTVVAQAPPQIPIPVVPTQIVTASVAQGQVQGQPTVVAPNPANPLHAPHFSTTVRAVEQAYFKQHQYLQQMRPLAEVIGTTNFFFLQDSELDSPEVVFTSNEGQNQSQSINSVSGSSTTGGHSNQPNLPPQQVQPTPQQGPQQPQIPAMPQQGGISLQKSQQQIPINNAPIPTQTFTNQSFPPIVPPPSAMFTPQTVQNSNEIASSQPQMQVFTGPLPIPQIVAQGAPQASVVVSGSPSTVTASVLKGIENQQQQQQQGVIQTQSTLIAGPTGANVPLPVFSSTVSSKFSSATTSPMVGGIHQQGNQKSQDNYEKIQKSKVEEIKERLERSNENSNDWETNDNLNKSHRISKTNEETNQWSNEVVLNNVKTNEWSNSNYENQSETNNWNSNNQNEGGYRNRGNNYGSSSRSGGNRGMRNSSGNSGGPPSANGYRGGRTTNSYQQQSNNRSSGIYFRNNNDGNGNSGGNNYSQYQNGGFNSTGGGSGKQDTYGGGNINVNYRPRGGPLPSSNRQVNTGSGGSRSGGGSLGTGDRSGSQRNAMSSNRSNSGSMTNPNRSGGGDRNSGRVTSSYGNTRPPNVRQQQQQQDINV